MAERDLDDDLDCDRDLADVAGPVLAALADFAANKHAGAAAALAAAFVRAAADALGQLLPDTALEAWLDGVGWGFLPEAADLRLPRTTGHTQELLLAAHAMVSKRHLHLGHFHGKPGELLVLLRDAGKVTETALLRKLWPNDGRSVPPERRRARLRQLVSKTNTLLKKWGQPFHLAATNVKNCRGFHLLLRQR
jgi:hypothetical protein